ncbi:MAG: hypothetical protein AB1777_00890 [Bacteroidota bacterium]
MIEPEKMNLKLPKLIFAIAALGIIAASCKSSPKKDSETSESATDTLSTLVKVENAIFPIPSPWQVVNLIQKNNIPFNEACINSSKNYQRYTTSFKQAINLGVYGTDLSYLNIYDKTQESLQYLGVIKKLSEQLRITESFDEKIFERIENNIENKDSLIKIISETYANSDLYLKKNERYDISALIVAGCWVESLYIMTQIAQEHNNREIINRIGEQKHPLDNLVELLTPFYYKSTEFANLLDSLIDLAYEFDGIIYSYSYREPLVDEKNKIITIRSQSRVVMSEYHLKIISKKIEQIRSSLTE